MLSRFHLIPEAERQGKTDRQICWRATAAHTIKIECMMQHSFLSTERIPHSVLKRFSLRKPQRHRLVRCGSTAVRNIEIYDTASIPTTRGCTRMMKLAIRHHSIRCIMHSVFAQKLQLSLHRTKTKLKINPLAYRHINTAEQRTIIGLHQYRDWYTDR